MIKYVSNHIQMFHKSLADEHITTKKKERKNNHKGSMESQAIEIHTFVGSRFTKPQARAATPRQPCEMATIPTESGPGYQKTECS